MKILSKKQAFPEKMCIFAVVIKKRNAMFTESELRPYTIEEINARIDQAERESALGLGIDTEEMLLEMDKELSREEKHEMAATL